MTVLIVGWVAFFFGTIFLLTLFGCDWTDDETFGIVAFALVLGWMWPAMLAVVIVIAILFLPTYGVYRLGRYMRYKFISPKETDLC